MANWKQVYAVWHKTHPLQAGGEAQLTAEEWELGSAIDCYKRANRRPFPQFSEVLAIIVALGYRRPAPAAVGPDADHAACGCRRLPQTLPASIGGAMLPAEVRAPAPL
jgi:hypothetical protein